MQLWLQKAMKNINILMQGSKNMGKNDVFPTDIILRPKAKIQGHLK